MLPKTNLKCKGPSILKVVTYSFHLMPGSDYIASARVWHNPFNVESFVEGLWSFSNAKTLSTKHNASVAIGGFHTGFFLGIVSRKNCRITHYLA